MLEKINLTNKYLAVIQIAVAMAVLYLTSWYSYVFFHSLVEIFSIVVAIGIFVVGWNSRRFIDNYYFLLIAIAFLFVGLFDLLHLFAYEGVSVLKLSSVNLSSQLWLSARFFAGFSLLIAPIFVKRPFNGKLVFFSYLLLFLVVLSSIIRWRFFPDVYIEGVGVTAFYVYMEYLVVAFYAGALIFLSLRRKYFNQEIYRWLALSLCCMLIMEMLLLNRLAQSGIANLLSHLFKTASFYLLYLGVIEMGLMKPYRVLFKNLKDSEKALKQSEERYRLLVEFSPDAMIVHDFGKILFVNAATLGLLDAKSENELIGKDIIQFFHPDFSETIASRLDQLRLGKSVLPSREVQMLSLRGRVIDVEIKGVVVTYEGKLAVQTMIRDITTRKLAFEDASDHVVITDQKGRIIYANKAAERMTGFGRLEMMGKAPSLWGNCAGKNLDADIASCQRAWDLIKQGNASFIGEVVNQRRNGEKYVADLHISPVYDDDNEISVYIWIERDVTRLKEIDRAKTEFVSLASHQLRTPIASISLSAELLLREIGGKLEPKQRQYIEEMFQQAKQMSELVDTLLNVSRIELGTFFGEKTEFDLIDRIKKIASPLVKQANKKNIKLQERYFAERLDVDFDNSALAMIVENLLSNAVYYTPEKGLITVAVNMKDDELVISVSDTGRGIATADQAKVFSKFFRSDSAQQNRRKGTGLGLYIVKSLVEKTNGRIWFDSVEGLGSTFYVAFPKKELGLGSPSRS
ncbi:PAS domain S-box protein [Candidatus Falkowbacteria bacterium]|nr:PAS domain S-box protein [Candidatus Falkowbacteria bacterium]